MYVYNWITLVYLKLTHCKPTTLQCKIKVRKKKKTLWYIALTECMNDVAPGNFAQVTSFHDITLKVSVSCSVVSDFLWHCDL